MIVAGILIAIVVGLVVALLLRRRLGWETATYLGVLLGSGVLTLALHLGVGGNWHRTFTGLGLGLTGTVAAFGIMEFLVLRFLANFRLGAIVRVTYYEALLHPFTLIILALGIFIIGVIAYTVPYYTLSEDFKMYRDVACQFTLLCALAVMVFASSKVIDEEIENRTMLTLMSKPIARWQVVIGKYLGVVAIVAAVMLVLGLVTIIGTYLRYFEDLQIDVKLLQEGNDQTGLAEFRRANTTGTYLLVPLLILQFLQVCTLGAIAVAISTRYPLALNVTAIFLLYVGANLTRFVPTADFSALNGPWPILWILAGLAAVTVFFVPIRWGRRWALVAGIGLLAALLHVGVLAAHGTILWKPFLSQIIHVLPYLANFDLDQRLIYGQVQMKGEFIQGVPTIAEIWLFVGLAGVYALLYISAALATATAMFRTRELT